MEDIDFSQIEQINYWQSAPKANRFLRHYYINQVISYIDHNNLLKVLVGQRRCGKSTILKQVIAKLIDTGVKSSNILYLNFELHELQFIKTSAMLIKVIETYYLKLEPKGRVYLFLDEIQEVEGWEKTVNSFLANDRYEIDIFLTGSNAKLLSTELATYVTGRYIEIPIYPFSLQEYCDYHQQKITRESLIQYLEDSGLPELFGLPQKSQKISYLMALQTSILMNDVVKRYAIKNPKLLSLLLDFLIDNIGKLFSLNSITKYLNISGITINHVTLANYLHYIEQTFLIHSVPRYDLKGKKILEGERKYYLNDLGFSNYLQSSFDNAITRRLENFVYLALLQAGYQIHVGNIYQLEIDFVAKKESKIIYVQVCYLLHDESVIAREYGNLEKIKDNWPKFVVSMDDFNLPSKNGITHIQAWQFSEFIVAEEFRTSV